MKNQKNVINFDTKVNQNVTIPIPRSTHRELKVISIYHNIQLTELLRLAIENGKASLIDKYPVKIEGVEQ